MSDIQNDIIALRARFHDKLSAADAGAVSVEVSILHALAALLGLL